MSAISAQRYLELDLLRTIAVVLMIVYHAVFDLAFFFDLPMDPFGGGWIVLQRCTAILFLIVVGVSFAISYGRMERRGAGWRNILMKYARRAAGLLVCAGLISIVTAFAAGEQWIRFGALHLIGTAVLLLPFLMPLREGTAMLALGVFLLSFFLPDAAARLHESRLAPLLLPLGIPPPAFASVDYLPLIPWLAPVLAGTALGNALYNRGWLRRHLPVNRVTAILTLPGRHALAIYLLHQPVLLAGLWLMLRAG